MVVNDDGGPGCASRRVHRAERRAVRAAREYDQQPAPADGRFTLSVTPGKKPIDPPDTRDCRSPGAASTSDQTAPEVRATHSIAIGQSVSGQITTSDEMWVETTYIQRWKVDGQPGQTVTIDLQSSDFDAYMMVRPGVPRTTIRRRFRRQVHGRLVSPSLRPRRTRST